MDCHTSLVIWSTCCRLNFLPNLVTLVVDILLATLFVAATLCLRLVVAKGLFGSRPSIATLCHTFLPSLPKVSSSKWEPQVGKPKGILPYFLCVCYVGSKCGLTKVWLEPNTHLIDSTWCGHEPNILIDSRRLRRSKEPHGRASALIIFYIIPCSCIY